jgi:adenosylcobinamide-phosphate synthase
MRDVLIAVVVDFILGDPVGFPHPVRLFGKLISFEEKLVRQMARNNHELKALGMGIVIVNILVAFLFPFSILTLLHRYGLIYHIVNVYLMYSTIAARCLRDEAYKIHKAFSKGIEEARYRLSFIVGRDTKNLNEKDIFRATIETVAENTSDGIIAPLLFAMLFGAPLAFVYKMVNTMDSMLGYLNDKYKYIGFFPAKTDDVFNFIPARLTGLLMNLSSFIRFKGVNGFKVMFRDRKNHKSPNCAYPEGAVAGLLGIQLGGDNYYFGEIMKKPRIGDPLRQLDAQDIKRTVEIMFRTELLMLFAYIIIEVIK